MAKTMFSIAYAYSFTHKQDDVKFYRSKLYESEEAWDYVKRVEQRAAQKGIELLDVIVYKGTKEVWRERL